VGVIFEIKVEHMDWDLSDIHYPQLEIKQNHVDGLSAWLEKIAELAVDYDGEWNVLIADLWPNDNRSRLIGHVQMKNVEIGYDTGYRVCAYLENGGIDGESGDDIPLVKEWLTSALAIERTNSKLRKLAQKNPFEIRLSIWGEGEISSAIEIKLQQI